MKTDITKFNPSKVLNFCKAIKKQAMGPKWRYENRIRYGVKYKVKMNKRPFPNSEPLTVEIIHL
jgi:hypothetical protein